jgi:N-acetylglucosamine kinase-like BadF-type ATPase
VGLSTGSYLLALEGGGTRSQAVVMDGAGHVLASSDAGAVNTNFVPVEQAQQAVLAAIQAALQGAGVQRDAVTCFVSSLVGLDLGAALPAEVRLQRVLGLFERATYRTYGEMEVVFARAGAYRPHGVALVAATGATTCGMRADDGRQVTLGGWGTLLGDEGSAYAVGLMGLRGAVRAFEQRATAPTGLVEAVCQHFGLTEANFHEGLIALAYQKPLSRTEIAQVAQVVTRLAQAGDPLALQITAKAANDLANLALSAARRLFSAAETFDVVLAGGLIAAGDLIVAPFQQRFLHEFPNALLKIGNEAPAVALGHLALYDLGEYKEEKP